jgi:NAD(P)-dependent dehydrogenase (short-subunit alcohol dehydrogenase family)
MKRSEKKVLIVKGGALGIGYETCILLARKSTKVSVANVLDKVGKVLAEEISHSGDTLANT